MKDDKKILKVKGFGAPLIITCPVCGYSFKALDPKSKKKVCPMCGHTFYEPNVSPREPKHFDNDFF
ncbi:MAG: hypothetical protein ACFFD5_06785 [Candidatus Thorarchaeota archaeon]